MEKNKTMKMILITLLIAVIALVLVSGTYAKYTSSASGSDTARVAKWSFIVGGNDIVAENTFTFDLFKTIKDTDGKDETDVVSANADRVIAPGTSGSFDLVLENKSETSAKYSVTYTVTNTESIPVQFSVNGTDWKDNIEELNISTSATDTKLDANNGTKTITIQWRWAYENTKENATTEDKKATDEKDMTLGKVGTAKLIVQADVTATQID
mgnify:FL=1